ncbi:5994_t:CDS:2 [Paraglomus brasilianum]|uniref:5994_t:CDS:1 n=1 Tax=Paraglomus brasilianum TaxID=144538 RepID=A0A9N9GQ18_9GLOM|nr:5994_t:CDS:2 [Paraglomus brasilianum]
MKASLFVLLFALFVCLSIAAPIPPANTPHGNFKVVSPAQGSYKQWSAQSVSWVVDWNEPSPWNKQVHVAIVGNNGFWKYIGKFSYGGGFAQINLDSSYTIGKWYYAYVYRDDDNNIAATGPWFGVN